MAAEDVTVTTTVYADPARGGSVVIIGTVHLTMTIHFDDPARHLRGSGIGSGVQVPLRAPGAAYVLWAHPAAWPTPWPAGRDARFPVAFTVQAGDTLSGDELRALSHSSAWSLELRSWDDRDGEYLVAVPVTIVVDTPG